MDHIYLQGLEEVKEELLNQKGVKPRLKALALYQGLKRFRQSYIGEHLLYYLGQMPFPIFELDYLTPLLSGVRGSEPLSAKPKAGMLPLNSTP